MPELPDIAVYTDHLERRLVGHVLQRVALANPFVLRTVDPPIADAGGRRVTGIRRLGKRIVLALDGERFIVIHLMIAGRLRWRDANGKPPGRIALASFAFESGTLYLTEAGTKRRASLHYVAGEAALAALDPGGVDVAALDAAQFAERIARGNHTIKRALTDPRLFSGIGNSYSDEILHRAKLSPFALGAKLSPADAARLHRAAIDVLDEWSRRLAAETGDAFPEKVTAFHDAMAVHGRYGKPCPDCGAPVQRIVYAENEANYCARCQTGGKVLADRALSRLLHDSWPKDIDQLL
ncbi:MAG TPA: DNA-formamidopyrimidine glycosylase family protein [Tahibacter sp.]|uniref:Fpg/Nei family DNA glycosylase n=1 Tax=Tahibacter sp. TaxID=2056211 RepID=UPI002CA5CA3D|nr:DNA-formamidopyrimidine glycosylase family protein [Tahibacter sp.]HSX60637.1 DNA-formamidopyrimidine glycosylase family protein [Tahibacter sp.]